MTAASRVCSRKSAAWRFARNVLLVYVGYVMMLALIQRALIYHPDRRAEIRPEHAGLPAGQVHTVEIATHDGLVLRGWHVLPNGTSAPDRQSCDRALVHAEQVVLYFSGNAGNRLYRVRQCTNLTGLGAHVLLFDYRGYGENPGKPSEAHLIADADAAWKYLTQDRGVPAGRIVLYGESLGGGVAVELAARLCRDETPPGGVFLQAAFSCLADVGAWHFPWLPVRAVLIDRFDSRTRMPSVTCPVMHVHGAADDIVPITLGRKLFAAAPPRSASGVKKRFVELPGVGHNDIPHAALREALAEFFRSLQASSASDRHVLVDRPAGEVQPD